MDAYEFYWCDSTKGYELIGVLPERRKNPAGRTQESVINLARGLLGHGVNVNRIFFIKATRDENTGKILCTAPHRLDRCVRVTDRIPGPGRGQKGSCHEKTEVIQSRIQTPGH
jgi:hypothetical protein